MTKLQIFVSVAFVSMLAGGNASAQSGFESSYPDVYEAEFPNRNLDGSLTPAGKLGLELPDGAARVGGATGAMARFHSAAARDCAQRYRSFDPSTNTFVGRDGKRHYCK